MSQAGRGLKRKEPQLGRLAPGGQDDDDDDDDDGDDDDHDNDDYGDADGERKGESWGVQHIEAQ